MGDFHTWFRTKRPPEHQSDRLWNWDAGGECGNEHEGYTWYRLNCSYWFGDWIETQDKELWQAYGERHRAIYIVREDLMTLIRLKWL
jgi:hypothetical protein